MTERSNRLIQVSGGPAQTLGLNLLTNTSGWFDAADYHAASFHIVGGAAISAGAIIFEGSNDGVNAVVMPTIEPAVSGAAIIGGAVTIAAAATRLFVATLNTRYIRVRVSTAFASDVVTCFAGLTNVELPYLSTSATVVQTTPASFQATITPAAGTPHTVALLGTTNLTSVKATAGNLDALCITNTSATAFFLKLYNKASAPVVASDIPVMVIPVAAGAMVCLPLGPVGQRFATGIAYATTALVANTDATAITAGSLIHMTYI